MNILVTGSEGFIGKNLIAALENIRDGKDKTFDITEDIVIYKYDLNTSKDKLNEYCRDCDFVYHLAGVNRPNNDDEFMSGNFEFTSELLGLLKQNGNTAPIAVTSSIQAALDNPYGKSKKAGEDILFNYGRENSVKVLIYRLPNVFGKWCRPNYNSAVATFCYNIARGIPITVSDKNHEMSLVYIDDVVREFIYALKGMETKEGSYCRVQTTHQITLGEICDMLFNFRKIRDTKIIPDMPEGSFEKKLYSTYLSYLPSEHFNYPLEVHCDDRGSFTELFKSVNTGQVSVNISKPGIVKGNHWHNTKNEKFVVVSGTGVIRFRKQDSNEIIEYFVSGDKLEAIDIPPGYTHNIENLGDTDMVTIMWCNEMFDPSNPDTFVLEV